MKILLLLALSWAWAGELRIVEADPLLRPGLLFRCTVLYSGPDVGPCTVAAALLQGDRVLSRLDLPLERSALLGRPGARLALPPPLGTGNGPPPRLAVTISGSGANAAAERAVGTIASARQAIEDHYQWLVASGERDPLPWLWIEQGAALANAATTLGNLYGLDAANTALAGWRAGTRPALRAGATLRALRDPVDGSVQPYRLHLPEQRQGAPLALLLGNHVRAPRKEHWPSTHEQVILELTSAGMTVIEAYPAGDLTWSGVAPRRARLALEDARATLGEIADRPLLIGTGNGAAGVTHLAAGDPERWGAVLLVDPRWDEAGSRPANLATLPIAVIGAASPAVRNWLDALRSAGGVPDLSLANQRQAANWMLSARRTILSPSTPRMMIRDTPGPAGPLLIEELAVWGQPAEVRWQGDPLRITTRGTARVRLSAPAPGVLIDGQPPQIGATGKPPRKAWGQACGPLAAYATAPFAIVVGTGESEAAVTANAGLAQRFLAAWVDHAQGAPPTVTDRDFRDRDWTGRNLVLIGNPRSNHVLRDLVEGGLRLPLEWDARSVRGLGRECLRVEGRAIALCWPHPAHDGRLLVVLDGAPAWPSTGLPLAGLPDLLIGPAPSGGGALLSRTFACDWR